jgi:hypothetical protein
LPIVISMPTILDGSPRSVTSHSAFISDFILFITGCQVIPDHHPELPQPLCVLLSENPPQANASDLPQHIYQYNCSISVFPETGTVSRLYSFFLTFPLPPPFQNFNPSENSDEQKTGVKQSPHVL